MGRLIEIASSGFDEWTQGIGVDPWSGSSPMGLRVPTLATPDPQSRYLFLLASFTIGEGASVKVKGFRQFLSLGTALNSTRFIEQEVVSPAFRLPDGNVSWSLRRLGNPNARGFPQVGPTPLDLRSFKKGWSDGPALLYADYSIPAGNRIYPQLTAYTPPNSGRPWGTPLPVGPSGPFTDLKTPWKATQAWRSLDLDINGPDTICFFASVWQSAGTYTVAAPSASFSGLNIPEEAFMANFGGSEDVARPIYWRVGGALIVEVQEGFVGP